MKPIGPLMREHRLIERMVGVIEAEQRHVRRGGPMAGGFIELAVDFFRTYADRTHHGKEEDILFRQLAMKNLSAEHEKIMKELIEEHAQAREMVGKLAGAGERVRRGDSAKLADIGVILEGLSRLYPRHIEKEDKHFFFPVMEYFSKEEQDAMLQEFWEFDRNMIHEKYRKLVEGSEA